MMWRTFFGMLTVMVVAAGSAQAAQVWESTFDSDTDGVVDIWTFNLGNAPIGTNNGGSQNILVQDVNFADANMDFLIDVDRAGRPLGSTLNGNDHSFSGLYQFSFNSFNQDEPEAYSQFGFLGDTGNAHTRQVMGTIIRTWKVGADHFIAVDVSVAGDGFSSFGYLGGDSTFLGADPTANSYQLGIGFDNATRELRLGLFDDQGTEITGQTVDLDTDVPGLLQFGGVDAELGSQALTHLGFGDYWANGGPRATDIALDTLAYYNDATGAFDAITGGGGILLGDANKDGQVTGADLISVQQNFGNVGPTPLQGDANNDGQVTGADLISVQQNFGNVAGPATAALPEPTAITLWALGTLGWLLRRPSSASRENQHS